MIINKLFWFFRNVCNLYCELVNGSTENHCIVKQILNIVEKKKISQKFCRSTQFSQLYIVACSAQSHYLNIEFWWMTIFTSFIHLYRPLLGKHSIRVIIDEYFSNDLYLDVGVPQDSVLSLCLSLMFIKNPLCITENPIQLQATAPYVVCFPLVGGAPSLSLFLKTTCA